VTRQDQRVGEGGQAIQANRDVNINQGLTPDQMLTIMDGVATQVQRGVERAAALVEERLAEFKQAVVEEFSKPETMGRTDAFQDPDFQFALHEAQKGFARSGTAELKEELVKLLSQRAAESDRNRVALILNEAIQTIGNLTKQEVSILSILFTVGNIQVNNAAGIAWVTRIYAELFTPFFNDFPEDEFAYDYLVSMKCTITSQISHTNIWSVMRERYDNVFSRGFMRGEVPAGLPAELVSTIIQPIPSAFDGRLRFVSRNRKELEKALTDAGLANEERVPFIALFDERRLDDQEFQRLFTEQVPVMGPLVTRWENTLAKSTHLTGLGKAIAHSALASRTTFSAPLEIWVK
jgi:hypothetical protein